MAPPCAIVTTPEIARALGNKDLVTVKAVQLARSHGWKMQFTTRGTAATFATRAQRSQARLCGGGHQRSARARSRSSKCTIASRSPNWSRWRISVISEEGRALRDILDGFYDRDGGAPCQIDGGLKCFGHPIGASGLRMAYEVYHNCSGRAGARQRAGSTSAAHPQSRRRSLPERRRRFDPRAGLH